MKVMVLLLWAGLLVASPAADQHDQHHAALDARGATFMGFDQKATAHHFILTKDGGRIEVTAKNAKDTASVTQIRDHLRHIAMVFANGDFALPGLVHDTRAVPGVDAMRNHAAALSYTFEEIDRGALVRITGASLEAIAAVHEFLRFQITDHKTGDPLSPANRK
ncbi:MAG: hypothetical protein M3541_15110 [Acidobacteriota bacterium]|jgi:hypothetical protein|nr:hypothetical protein [Acidobacteriota bacterium]MDQ3420078.1 hypothetical protein [Acidobacteriota bacterium]